MSNHSDIAAVYRQHADMLYRIAVSMLQNTAEAEDALQDVFEKYIALPIRPLDEEHTKAWLIRVMINRCHDRHRREKLHRTEKLDTALLISDHTQDHEGLLSLMEKLHRLPEKLRNVVILHCLEGFSLQETARLLRISHSAAKMRLQRAREMLKKQMEEEKRV